MVNWRTIVVSAVMLWFFGLVALLGSVQEVRAKPGTVDDRRSIHGEWAITAYDDGTKGKTQESFKKQFLGSILIINGDGVRVKNGGSETMKIHLSPSRTPKAIDLVIWDITYRGAYELKGDVLKVCFANKSGMPRPTKLATKPTGEWLYLALGKKKNPK